MTNRSQIQGTVDPQFAACRDAFEANFQEGGERGAACAIYRDGQPVLDLWGGSADASDQTPWYRNTAVPVFSVTKGISALCVLSQVSNGRIDLDLRRATIADIFGLEGPEGVTEYLLGDELSLSQIGRRIGTSNLVVYPTFPAPVNSAELMVSDRLLDLVARARALGEDAVVIFDLPPVFANDDAILVAEQLDGILLVVEQGVTTKKQLQSSLQLLHPTPLLGTIFNRFTGGSGDPYGYGGKYDGYYSD